MALLTQQVTALCAPMASAASSVGGAASATPGLTGATPDGTGLLPPGASSGVVVKLSVVADQTSEATVPLLTNSEIAAHFAAYEGVLGGQPAPEEECTSCQLSALKALLKAGPTPCVDFALFGPHSARSLRRLKFTGMQLNAAGALVPVEFYGPANFEDLEACYRVWLTGMFGCKAI